MAHSSQGWAGSSGSSGAAQRLKVRYPMHRCPECGSYTHLVRRPTGEVYLACRDRIECGYQEALA